MRTADCKLETRSNMQTEDFITEYLKEKITMPEDASCADSDKDPFKI